MKARKQRPGFRAPPPARAVSFVLTCCALSGLAATPVMSSVDSGGGSSGAGVYVNDGYIGGCGGVSAAGATAVRHGFAGQLTEPASVVLKGSPGTVAEGAASQLSGTATLDDETFLALAGGDIVWGAYAYPLASVSSSGVAVAAIVYSNTSAAVRGTYLGLPGTGTLHVLDTLPDNYGSYAGDGLPDWWQASYFGLDNADALAGRDPDGDGQDNVHEWMALTAPNDSESHFRLSIAITPGSPGSRLLVFSPRSEERIYTPLYKTALTGNDPWVPLTTVETVDADSERYMTDTNATSGAKFYRIQIGIP